MKRLLLALLALACAAAPAAAQSVGHKLDGRPGWVAPGAIIDMDCANQKFWPPDLLNRLTFTRASVGMAQGADGTWYTFPSGQIRMTSAGCLLEEARTNLVPNGAVAGSTPGTPGTPPTGWSMATTANGITRTIGATHVVNGLTFLPVTFAGTATGNFAMSTVFAPVTGMAATPGQTFSGSVFAYLSAGSVPHAVNTELDDIDSGGGFIAGTTAVQTLGTVPARLAQSRSAVSGTTVFVRLVLQIVIQTGDVVSFTIETAAPQVEFNTLIPQTVAAGTVASGGTGCTNTLQTYTVVGGTKTVAATFTGTASGGVLGGTLNVTNAGTYTVFPTDPPTMTGGGCATPPTVHLTATQAGAQGFATSPLVTTGASASRAADIASLLALPTGAAPISGFSLLASGVPATPGIIAEVLAEMNDGTANNRALVLRNSATGPAGVKLTIGGVVTNVTANPTWTNGALGKITLKTDGTTLSGVFNNGAMVTGAATGVPPVNRLFIGSTGTANWWNGTITRLTVSPQSLLAQ